MRQNPKGYHPNLILSIYQRERWARINLSPRIYVKYTKGKGSHFNTHPTQPTDIVVRSNEQNVKIFDPKGAQNHGWNSVNSKGKV